MNMDTTVLLVTVISILTIPLFSIISVKSKFARTNKYLFMIAFGVWFSAQTFAMIMLLVTVGVFEPSPTLSEKSSVQDSSAATLQVLLEKEDFPDNWNWVSTHTNQPSDLPWIDSTTKDSANIFFVAKVPHLVIFKHYARAEHIVQVFDSPLSETEFSKHIPIKSEDGTSFAPNLNQKGKYFYVMCVMGSDYYSCDVSMGYDYIISSIWIMTPEELGKQYMIDLLNSAIELIDQRIQKIPL